MKFKISEYFNAAGTRATVDAFNKWNVGGALAVGAALLPFSTTFALAAMALPTVYFGAGLALKGAARLLEHNSPTPPSNH